MNYNGTYIITMTGVPATIEATFSNGSVVVKNSPPDAKYVGTAVSENNNVSCFAISNLSTTGNDAQSITSYYVTQQGGGNPGGLYVSRAFNSVTVLNGTWSALPL